MRTAPAATTGVGRVFSGGKATETHKANWWYGCNAEAAESILQQVRPYLRIKGPQADLAMEVQERLRKPADKADRSWHGEYRDRMKTLNRRGPA